MPSRFIRLKVIYSLRSVPQPPCVKAYAFNSLRLISSTASNILGSTRLIPVTSSSMTPSMSNTTHEPGGAFEIASCIGPQVQTWVIVAFKDPCP